MSISEIRKIFSDPYALKKAIKRWKDAERGGEEFIRKLKEERKRLFSISVSKYDVEFDICCPKCKGNWWSLKYRNGAVIIRCLKCWYENRIDMSQTR